jgi:malonate transporter and related proteins
VAVIVNSLVPVLALILAGYIINRSSFLPASFWPSAEKLTYYCLMPAMLVQSLAGKKMDTLPWFKILLTVEGTVLASAILITGWWLFNRQINGRLFTSIFQGGVRFNSFVTLALAESLYGRDGLMLAAVGTGFMIILVNVLCVSAFSLTVNKQAVSLKGLFNDLLKNPLLIACLIGVVLNISGIKIPTAVDSLLVLGGKAAFPLGLMAVGASYCGGNFRLHFNPIVVTSVVQFLFKPVMAGALAAYSGLPGSAASILILLFCVPTASSAYILAKQLGGDHEVMASIITVQTCISFLTMPVTIWLFS